MTSSLAAAICLAATLPTTVAGDFAAPLEVAPVQEDEWEFALGVYAFMPEITATAANGYDINIDFDQILESLDMTAMIAFMARKGRWSLGSDLIYLAMGNDIYGAPGASSSRVALQLKTWIINPVVGYTVLDGNWGHLDVMGGARYLYMKQQVGVSVASPILGNTHAYASSSGASWAGIVGIKGQLDLSEKWFMPYYLDVGTGDSDLTWQAYLGIGYRFENFDLVLSYRYIDWDLGTGGPLTSLDSKGPQLGIRFEF
jgi:hypothetical protein